MKNQKDGKKESQKEKGKKNKKEKEKTIQQKQGQTPFDPNDEVNYKEKIKSAMESNQMIQPVQEKFSRVNI